MATIGDGFKNIFLAGIGAMAYTGQVGKQIVDQLVEKGEIAIDQGKGLNTELSHNSGKSTKDLRESALEASMKLMSKEEREAFAIAAARIAAEQNAADAEREDAADDQTAE